MIKTAAQEAYAHFLKESVSPEWASKARAKRKEDVENFLLKRQGERKKIWEVPTARADELAATKGPKLLRENQHASSLIRKMKNVGKGVTETASKNKKLLAGSGAAIGTLGAGYGLYRALKKDDKDEKTAGAIDALMRRGIQSAGSIGKSAPGLAKQIPTSLANKGSAQDALRKIKMPSSTGPQQPDLSSILNQRMY